MKYLIILTVIGGGCCGQKGPIPMYALAALNGDTVVSVSAVYLTAMQLSTRCGYWDGGRAEGLEQEQLQTIYNLLLSDKELVRKSFTIRGLNG
jgi:hypothetical protein